MSGENVLDLSGDGGVLKEILSEGVGFETPTAGCKVSVHYTGTLLDGTKFDSSLDRNEPFEFELGKGVVIKAFDMGILTMKREEKCILTCAPSYAYGALGSPPNIPPNATLKFELQMLGWKGEDLSPNTDGSIQRYILKDSPIPTDTDTTDNTPNNGANVSIHLIGSYENKVFEERDISFNIGEGCEIGIISGVEIALEKFKLYEESKLVIKAPYAFGKEGKKEFGIPPNATVEYTVTLKEFEREPDSWRLYVDESLAHSKIFKEKGTNYFKANKIELALKMYEKSMAFLSNTSNDESKQVKLAIYLNQALCQQKLNNHVESINACEEALLIDPNCIKALYRRGQSNMHNANLEEAIEDFNRVIKIEPENKAALNQIAMCKQKIKEYNNKQKQLYANMFSKFAEKDKMKEDEENLDRPDVMIASKFGEWKAEERDHEPTKFEQENPDVIMLDEALKKFKNM